MTETLKQKVQANAQRIRRYEKRETQYSQNTMFKEDTKKLYGNLSMKNIGTREPPSVAEAETYWRSLWGEEAQHNERAEWIRREQKKIKLVIWIGSLYRLRKLLYICRYLTIGNHLEMIKYKTTGLKLSQLLTTTSKNFNAIIQEAEKALDWLSTGITYLIPKSGDNKEVRNYRPITCLTTMYKTLTRIIAKRISTHLEEQSFLPAEQKGCHPGSKGCKDQLMISKVIYEDCRRMNKYLNIASLITRNHLKAFHIAGWKSQ